MPTYRDRVSVWRETPPLISRFGEIECIQRVTSISLDGVNATDDVVPLLRQLKQLRNISFGPTTTLSADGLRRLRDAFPNCEVNLSNSRPPNELATSGI
jgi:hypothetical protein